MKKKLNKKHTQSRYLSQNKKDLFGKLLKFNFRDSAAINKSNIVSVCFN